MQKELKSFQKQGFSLVELLVTIAIVGLLALMGMRSYRTQVFKSRTAEAKHSLSFVYQAEKQFKEDWNTYHPSLMALGMGLSGTYNYDVGFGSNTNVSMDPDDYTTYSFLNRYPQTDFLKQRECTNFEQMCNGDCKTALDTAMSGWSAEKKEEFIRKPKCEVKCSGNDCISTNFGAIGTASKATQSKFKAMAVDTLKELDIWSIDQNKTFKHEVSGIE